MGLSLFSRTSVPAGLHRSAAGVLGKSTCLVPAFAAPLAVKSPSVASQPRHLQRGAHTPCRAATDVSDLEQMITQKLEQTPVVIFSKSYCPFSSQVKSLFNNAGVQYKAFELDQIEEGEDILDSLVGKTGSRTVPQVFVKSQYIGGCDDTMAKQRRGELVQILEEAGIKSKL